MLVQDLFDYLNSGELSQMDVGKIEISDYPKIISHLNLALTALHKRFLLREEDIYIQQYEQIQAYKLRPEFAVTNTASTEPIKYLIDSEYVPFRNNILKVERVFDEANIEMGLNDSNDPGSAWLTEFDVVNIPYPRNENTFSVVYRANHPKLVVDGSFNPATTQIHIPQAYEEPLLFYIASRIFTPIGNDGNNYINKYEASCVRLETENMHINNNYANHRLDMNGWV